MSAQHLTAKTPSSPRTINAILLPWRSLRSWRFSLFCYVLYKCAVHVHGLDALPWTAPRTFHRQLDFIDHQLEPIVVELGAVNVFHINQLGERIAAPPLGQFGPALEWLGEHSEPLSRPDSMGRST